MIHAKLYVKATHPRIDGELIVRRKYRAETKGSARAMIDALLDSLKESGYEVEEQSVQFSPTPFKR